MWTPDVNLTTNNAIAVWDTIGNKQYELDNHLGNVLATITDKKLQHTTNNTSIDYYLADVSTAQEYYPFGMLMPGRQVLSANYRYGFNGQEKSDEINSDGNHYEFKYREYDPRIGKFWSVDPLEMKYPWNSSYAFAENRVIDGIDLEGLEWYKAINLTNHTITNTVKVKVLNSANVPIREVHKEMIAIAAKVKAVYKGKVGGMSITTKVEYTFVKKVDANKDFYIDFVNTVQGAVAAPGQQVTGKVNTIGNEQSNRIQILTNMNLSNTAETGAHELGHTGGLRHETDPSNPPQILNSMRRGNIMRAVDFGNNFSTPQQLQEINRNTPTGNTTITPASPPPFDSSLPGYAPPTHH